MIVPARNEAANLARLLPTLIGDESTGVEVVVVDDGSADATAQVARDLGARVVQAPPLPPGWTGKTWACASGAGATGGDVVAFVDADVRVERDGVERVLAVQEDVAGLVSVAPFHAVERPYERASAFFNLVAMMGTDAFAVWRDRVAPAGAFGPCLVLDRVTYEAAGGHEAVRAEVLDDVELCRAVRAAGAAVRCWGGHGAVVVRMYPDGMAQLVEGWTKNIAGGAGRTRPLTLVLVSAWLSGCITAAAAPLLLGWAGLALYAAYALQVHVHLRRIGSFGVLTALLFPLPLVFFLAVFARSLVLTHLRRRVSWRGRSIEV